MKNYSKLSDEELSEEKRKLDKKLRALRSKKLLIKDSSRKNGVGTEMRDIRKEKLAIQEVQDSRMKPLPKADFTLGVSGIESETVFGKIGGS